MSDDLQRVVIVGAGQAGGQAAYSLRLGGFAGEIILVGDEPVPPYQRPPLSKAYLKGEIDADRLYLKPTDYYPEHKIDLVTGEPVATINLDLKQVSLANGRELRWDKLVIATGARPRKLNLLGADQQGIIELRTLKDVDRLKHLAPQGSRLVVIGAGYIGLEAAAVGAQLGLKVTVLEAMPQVLSRVAGPEIGAFYTRVHREAGTDVRLGVRIEAFEGSGSVSGVRLADGEIIPADVVLVGVGVLPNLELALEAGIVCGNGIVVDQTMRTSHPDVFAIGDVACRPLVHYGRDGRLESVHNAIEGGKLAAAAILGLNPPALEAPWFWSDQFDLKLQTAGLSTGADERVVRGDPVSRTFAVFYLREGHLLAVDAVNSAAEFIVGKKLVAGAAMISPTDLVNTSMSMRDVGALASN